MDYAVLSLSKMERYEQNNSIPKDYCRTAIFFTGI